MRFTVLILATLIALVMAMSMSARVCTGNYDYHALVPSRTCFPEPFTIRLEVKIPGKGKLKIALDCGGEPMLCQPLYGTDISDEL